MQDKSVRQRNPAVEVPTILVPAGYYYPAFRAGGPVRTLVGQVQRLSNEFRFKIIAHNHDLGDSTPFPSTFPDQWQNVDGADVYYMSGKRSVAAELRRLINETPHDLLYLNSFFDLYFSIAPLLWRRFGLIPKKPVLLGPRGELTPGAMSKKRFKKNVFLGASKLMGLHRGIVWHASDELECNDIRKMYGCDRIDVQKARDLRPAMFIPDTRSRKKEKGKLNLIFLSRIDPKKRLHVAIETLRAVKGNVTFNIVGPYEERQKNYYDQCLNASRDMPGGVTVNFCGEVDGWKVGEVFVQNHAFFLPTLSENYGHVIAEALSAGCPVVISDQTPWKNLEKQGIGWDVPVNDSSGYTKAIQTLIDMDGETYEKMSRMAATFGERELMDEQNVEDNRIIFRTAMENNKTKKQ